MNPEPLRIRYGAKGTCSAARLSLIPGFAFTSLVTFNLSALQLCKCAREKSVLPHGVTMRTQSAAETSVSGLVLVCSVKKGPNFTRCLVPTPFTRKSILFLTALC